MQSNNLTKEINVFRYIVPINPSDNGESQTCDVISMHSNRPRKRRVDMMKYLRAKFMMNNKPISRCQASALIRGLDFSDITLCGN